MLAPTEASEIEAQILETEEAAEAEDTHVESVDAQLAELKKNLHLELHMTTVESEYCSVPSMVQDSARSLALAMQLSQEEDTQLEDHVMIPFGGLKAQGPQSVVQESKADEPVDWSSTPYCRICYSAYDEAKYECCISICDTCMPSVIKTRAEHGFIVPCPGGVCGKEITPADWALYLTPEEIAPLLERRQAREIDRNPNARWCPNPKCCKPVFLAGNGAETERDGTTTEGGGTGAESNNANENDEQSAQPPQSALQHDKKCLCSHCSTSFCRDCNAIWTRNHRFTCTGDDIGVWRWAIFKDTCRCPFCKSRIEKESGCNHMTCGQCQGEFCWLCRRPYQPGHFDEISGCPGLQYSPINLYGRSAPVRAIRKTTLAVTAGSIAIGLGAAACGLAVVGGVFYGMYLGGRQSYRAVNRMRNKS